MNLLYKRLLAKNLAIWTFVSLVSFACTSITDIGLDTLPSNERQGLIYSDTSTILTGNLLRDSIITSNRAAFMIGSYDDAVFGHLGATGYMQLLPNASLTGFPDSALYDSMTVEYDISYAYGDTSKAQSVYLRQLSDTIGASMKYGFSSKPDDGVNFDTIKFALKDLSGTLKFKIDAYGRRIFNQGNSVFTNQDLFTKTFKGWKFVSDKDNSAMIRLDLTYGANIRMYYHKPKDTTAYYIFLNTSSNNANFTQYSSERLAGSELASLQKFGDKLPLQVNREKLYIQSGGGVAGLVKFPNLMGLNNLGKDILITRVVLEMTPLETTVFAPNSGLSLYQWDMMSAPVYDANGLVQYVYNDNSLSAGFQQGGYLNSATYATGYPVANGNWEINITTYVREILAGKRANNGILIVPYTNAIAVNRTVIAGPGYSDPTKKMKLKVYYIYP